LRNKGFLVVLSNAGQVHMIYPFSLCHQPSYRKIHLLI